HLYLAAAGLAVALGIGINALWLSPRRLWHYAGAVGGALLVIAAVIVLQRPLAEWNTAAVISRRIVHDVEREAATTAGGTLLILGAPQFRTPTGRWGGRTFVWSWALPFAVQPPFTQTDLTERVYVIERPEVYCCPLSQWFTHVRASLQTWSR